MEKMGRILMTCRDRESLLRAYIPAVRQGGWEGGIEILVPGDSADLRGSWEGVAGLLLAGGGDIHPKNWDEDEPPHLAALVDEDRDSLEIPIALRAWELNLPIFGVCRGGQLLNVALGGSLIQDIPSACGCGHDVHRHGDSLTPDLRHFVRVEAKSLLGRALGRVVARVNSRHHQAVARVAPPLKAVAWHDETLFDTCPLIEGVEAVDTNRWALGVQWHPENLVGLDNDGGEAARRLFRAFASRLNENK